MATIKYYLEKRRTKDSKVNQMDLPIYLIFTFDGKRFQYKTEERVDQKHWDSSKQRVKSGVSSSFEINMLLDKYQEELLSIYRRAKLSGLSPTVQYIKSEFIYGYHSTPKSFVEHYQEFLNDKKVKLSEASIKKYTTLKNHLTDFQQKKKYVLEYGSINDEFFAAFLSYYLDVLNLNNNTINRNIKTLKSFLNWASVRGYNRFFNYKRFSFKGFDSEIIYLTTSELQTLYSKEIENMKLERVRDIFCFGCFTGLRYSDIKNLKWQNIREDYIRSFSIKTKDQLSVPLNNFSKEILSKYRGYDTEYCFPVYSNQKMNEYLKELGEYCEIDTPINYVQYKGSERVEEILNSKKNKYNSNKNSEKPSKSINYINNCKMFKQLNRNVSNYTDIYN